MNDVYPRTTVNDLTFILTSRRSRDFRTDYQGRATIIRPGMLTATDSVEAYYRRYVDQAIRKGRLFAPLVEEWMRPEPETVAKAGSSAVAPQVKAARYAGLVAFANRAGSKLTGYSCAIADGNWRAFFAVKHKQYTVERGVRLRANTFHLQSAALVLVAVMVLASANTLAPSFVPSGSPRAVDTPIDQPIHLASDTSPPNGSAATNPSGRQDADISMRLDNGSTTPTHNGWLGTPAGITPNGTTGNGASGNGVAPGVIGTGNGTITAPTTPSAPVTPSESTAPIVTLPPVVTDPVPTNPEEPIEPIITVPDPVTPTPPADPPLLEGVVDDVTDTLGGVVDDLL